MAALNCNYENKLFKGLKMPFLCPVAFPKPNKRDGILGGYSGSLHTPAPVRHTNSSVRDSNILEGGGVLFWAGQTQSF